MNILKTEEQLIEKFSSQRLNPPNTIDTKGYRDLAFECGCGKFHGVNDFDVERLASALPVKAIYRCSSHITFIHIKGLFRQKCITEWSATTELFGKVAKTLGMD